MTLKAIENLKSMGFYGFPTSAINKINMVKLVQTAEELMEKTSRTHTPHNPHKPRGGRFSSKKFTDPKQVSYSNEYKNAIGTWLMIGGMPNLGKSTIINKLRQQSPKIKNNYASKVTKTAATTKHLSGFKVSTDPNMWIVDTPGLMVPSIIENDMAIKLSLVGCIRDKILGPDLMVELMLESLDMYN